MSLKIIPYLLKCNIIASESNCKITNLTNTNLKKICNIVTFVEIFEMELLSLQLASEKETKA